MTADEAETLPVGSVVATSGVSAIKVAADLWSATTGAELSDSGVDYSLSHGATVLRKGPQS